MRINGLIGGIFIFVGFVFFSIAILSGYDNSSFMETAVEHTATISKIVASSDDDGIDYSVYVSYEYNNEYYKDVLFSYHTSDMKEGQTIKIYVNPENAREISSGDESESNVAFAAFGLVMMIVGIILVVVLKNMPEYPKNSINNSIKIYARVFEIKEIISLHKEDEQRCYLMCRYGDESGPVYKSQISSKINRNYLHRDVAVYIDKEDSSRYFVNIDDII